MMAKRMILNLGLAAVLLPRLLCAQQAGKQEERSNDTVAPATISAGQAPAANATLVAATTTQVAPSTTLQAATTIPAATTPTGTTPTAQTTTMAATTSMAEETTTSIAAATTTSAAATTKYISNANVIRILHLSDTHNLHDSIESKFPLPPADILIHTGDFCNFGKDTELTDANKWLGTLASRYKHIIIILGNHDWGCCSWPAGQAAAKPPSFWRSKFSNAHLLWSESVTVMGLKIYGTSWKGDTPLSNQKNLGKIPSGMDILLTHGPAFGILDFCGKGPWGSSEELLNDILVAKPKVHLFGHDHEQRGLWQRKSPGEPYVGGVEYHISRGSSAKAFGTTGPPPAQYAVEVVSNNAMMNQPAYEGWLPQHIAGPARLIVATKSNEEWHFSAEKYDLGPSCGNITNAVNAKCMEKVIWAASGGGKNNANAGTWFGKMLGIAGVSYQDASQEDFHLI